MINERLSRPDEDAFDVFTGLHGSHWLALASIVMLGAAIVASLVSRESPPGEPS